MSDHNAPAPDFHDIDKNRLDEEWVAQPRLYRQHAEMAAEAARDLAFAKTQLSLAEAEARQVIKQAPEEYGLEGKTTVDDLKAAVATHKRVRRAQQDVIDKEYRADVVKAALRTIEHRKSALQDLVQLRLADYYAEPRLRGEPGKVMTEGKADRAFGHKKRRPE